MMLDLQKATFSKRISAFLFDLIVFFIVVVGVSCIVNPMVGYDEKVKELEVIYQEYSERFGIDTELTQEQFDNMTQEEKDAYNARVEEANKALNEDEHALELYHRIIVLFLFNITISTLVAYLALEFAIPLLLGNGQTLGKKIFGIGLMRADGVKITPVQVFVRSILGKYTLETMIPVLIIGMIITKVIGLVGIIVLLGIVIIEVFAYFKSGTNSLIHDLVAVTVCIDVQSQLIFETEEELIEYKKRLAEESVGRFAYGAESVSSVYSSGTVEVEDKTEDTVEESGDEGSSSQISTLTLATITVGDDTYENTAQTLPEVDEGDGEEQSAPDEADEAEEVDESEEVSEDETPEEESETDKDDSDAPAEEEAAEACEETSDEE